jgi:16S rRNA G527 N7-methylase RsmG
MLGLKRVEAIHGRVQDEALLQVLGGRFDITLSRAFSDLRTFLVLSFPFLKVGGSVIVMKGGRDNGKNQLLTEKERARYRLQKTVPLILPFSTFKRTLFLFEKI